jgi:hypothetical protein
MKFNFKLSLILSLSYLGIFLLTGAYSIWFLFRNPYAELWGMLLILVTLPWGVILAPIIDSLGFIAWYNQFAGNHIVDGLFVILTFMPAALINATILYFIGRLFDKAIDKGNLASEAGASFSPISKNNSWKKFNLFFWFFFFLSIISFFQVFLPTAQLIKYISIISIFGIIAKYGSIIVLSYFGYVITRKKPYLLLGLLGLFPVFSVIGLIIGYIVLWYAKKNLRFGTI